jgi:hypothetical protein
MTDTTLHPALLHPRTGEPILPLGYGRRGPIWPILGASDDDEAGDAADDDGQDGDDSGAADEGADALGDAGKKALDAMKAERNAARKELREARRALEEAKTARTEGDQPDPEAIKAEARREATKAANERIVRSEVKAAAGQKLADPADAVRLLDLSQFEVDDDGNVDEDEIADAIDDLLKKKPYLAAQGGKRFQGSGDGGARKGSTGPTQLKRTDLQGMTPAQIETARAEGRLADVLAGK